MAPRRTRLSGSLQLPPIGLGGFHPKISPVVGLDDHPSPHRRWIITDLVFSLDTRQPGQLDDPTFFGASRHQNHHITQTQTWPVAQSSIGISAATRQHDKLSFAVSSHSSSSMSTYTRPTRRRRRPSAWLRSSSPLRSGTTNPAGDQRRLCSTYELNLHSYQKRHCSAIHEC